jgi:ankyrin repeat protein
LDERYYGFQQDLPHTQVCAEMAAPPPPPADMLALQDQEDEDTELPSELFTDETAQQELYQACRTGDLAGVQAAIDAGASVRAILKGVKRDKTCLLVAVAKGHLEVVKLLLALGADVNAKAKGTLFNALHYACEKGHVDIVKFFHVEKGFSIEEKAVNDLLPIHLAVLQCKSSVLKYLVERFALVHPAELLALYVSVVFYLLIYLFIIIIILAVGLR